VTGETDSIGRKGTMPTSIIKVGGSLLMLPDLPDRLRQLIDTVRANPPVAHDALVVRTAQHPIAIVVGGGTAANVVRDWDSTHRLNPDASHWLAVDSLSLTAEFIATLLPEAVLADSRDSADRAFESNRLAIVVPRRILEAIARSIGDDLPHNWDVTTDSIAAWIAIHWQADELVLAKSIDVPETASQVADAVDGFFETLRPQLSAVRWCNLQAAPTAVSDWAL
jgi:5-(aminomethyl)-3-furanmethanol phosphate kinase